MTVINSMLGNAVQTRIGYRQCECGRRKCRHDRKMERKIQKHVEGQRVRKEIQERLNEDNNW